MGASASTTAGDAVPPAADAEPTAALPKWHGEPGFGNTSKHGEEVAIVGRQIASRRLHSVGNQLLRILGASARIGYEARPLGVDAEFDGAHRAGVNERSC